MKTTYRTLDFEPIPPRAVAQWGDRRLRFARISGKRYHVLDMTNRPLCGIDKMLHPHRSAEYDEAHEGPHFPQEPNAYTCNDCATIVAHLARCRSNDVDPTCIFRRPEDY